MSERIFTPGQLDSTPAQTNTIDGLDSHTLGTVFDISSDMDALGGAWYVPNTIPAVLIGGLFEWTSNGVGIERARKNWIVSGSGWQSWTYDTPYRMLSGRRYVTCVYSSQAYVSTSNYFTAAKSNGQHITAIADTAGANNGKYHLTVGGPSNLLFPENSFGKACYFVDIIADAVSTNLTVQNAQQDQTSASPLIVPNLTVANALQALRSTTVDFDRLVSLTGNMHGNDQAAPGAVSYTPIALNGGIK